MGEKIKFNSKTIKELREKCDDETIIREACKDYHINDIKKECNRACEQCYEFRKHIPGVKCVPQSGKIIGLSQPDLLRVLKNYGVYRSTKSTISGWENDHLPVHTKAIKKAYADIFNVEFEDENEEEIIPQPKKKAKNDEKEVEMFKKSEPVDCDCLHRDSDIEKLKKYVGEHNVIIVCADGGVGKTTLVEKFLYEEKNNALKNITYYQTVILSERKFNEDDFIEKIELTTVGKELLNGETYSKKEFVHSKLSEGDKTFLFVIDGLDTIDIGELDKLRAEHYTKCKFIITTRRVENKSDANIKKIIYLENFNKEQALEIFNNVRKNDGNARIEKAEDVKIFNEVIYPWCEGNAEVLYFIAKMLSWSKLSDFKGDLEKSEFEANVSRGEKNESTMSEKLRHLFGFENYLPDFNKTDWGALDKEQRIRAIVLAIVSATRMNKVAFDKLVEFLTEKGMADKSETKKAIIELEKCGFIKRDINAGFYMHDLMANAMELNGIDNVRVNDNDTRVLPYLLLWDKKIYEDLRIDKIESLRIPKFIDTIKEGAFKDNKALKCITISEGVTSIGTSAFEGCTSLENVSFEENSNLKKICASAFSKTAISAIGNLPESLKEIEEFAFKGCEKLVSIFIPKKVLRLKANFVDGCYCLEKISVDKGNKVFYSNDDILYSRREAKPVLLRYAPGRKETTYCVSDAFFIGPGAFADCQNLEEIEIGYYVEEIGDYAFINCSKLWDYHLDGNKMLLDYKGRRIFKETPLDGCAQLYSWSAQAHLFAEKKNIKWEAGVLKIGKNYTAEHYFCAYLYIKEFLVDEENEYYASIDGNLYTKDKKTLIRYAHDKEETEFVVPPTVEVIVAEAFTYADNLKSVIITENVKKIDRDFCKSAKSIERFVVESGNTYFKSIDGNLYNYEGTELLCLAQRSPLKRLKLPETVERIVSDGTILGMRELVVSEKIKDIPQDILQGEYLESIQVDQGNDIYCSEDGVLYDRGKTTLLKYPAGKSDLNFVIPRTVSKISFRAFANAQIESVFIPKGIETIEAQAFFDCKFLEKVEFEENCQLCEIEELTFFGNNSLESIKIPCNISIIGNKTFSNCQNLKHIDFERESKIGIIGDVAFSYCDSLTHIDIPKRVKEIGTGAFLWCPRLKRVSFCEDSQLELIGKSAFSGCTRLKSIEIPNGVKLIGGWAFSGCYELEEAILNKDSELKTIGYCAFQGCGKIKSIVIPNKTKIIGESAFYGCEQLETVIFSEENDIQLIEKNAFGRCAKLAVVNLPQNTIIEDDVFEDGVKMIKEKNKTSKNTK